MKKNVIFDLDGTLLDTSAGIFESIRYTENEMDFNKISESRLKSFIGPPLKQSFIREYACSDEEADNAVKLFREYYQKGAVFNSRPYEGIYDLCKNLKEREIGIALATNKLDRFALGLIKKFKFEEYFNTIRGADELGKLKKADLINLCIDDLHSKPQECILIGDTENDAWGAEETGVNFIAVTYGFGFKTESDINDLRCLAVVDTPLQVLNWI